ncbi:MAG TPA: hypothetical protein VF131_25480 [Blastocatellia bacterium]|nr:hypothetical protein [Blastocatellia bacterium]
MKIDDVKKALENAKYVHLTDGVLTSYRDQLLDQISRRQADAHLKLCLICVRRLSVFQEERAAVYGGDGGKPSAGIALREHFAEYLRQAVENWKACFAQLRLVREAIMRADEIWRWQSEDGVLTAYAILEPTADLAIRICSNETDLEGEHLKVRVGSLIQETILQRVSDLEVRAEVMVSRRRRPRDMTDVSIEMV